MLTLVTVRDHYLIALLLFAAAAAGAQDPPTPASPELTAPVLTAYSGHDALRQGAAMQFALIAAPGQKSPLEVPPALLWRNGKTEEGSSPTSLELQPDEGLIVSAVTNPTAHSAQVGDHAGEALDRTSPFRFLVVASPSASPGEYRVHARLRYRITSDELTSVQRELRFYIPVQVVGRDAYVRVAANPYMQQERPPAPAPAAATANHDTRDQVMLILLAPVVLPLVILGGIICQITQGPGNCGC